MLQSGSVSTLGPIRHWPAPPSTERAPDTRSCPFVVPSAHELFVTLPQASTGSLSRTLYTANSARSIELTDRATHNDTTKQPGEEEHVGPILLRWLPFGLQRIIPGLHNENAPTEEMREIREVTDFVRVLQQELTTPVRTPDGREVIVIVNDRLPEMELVLRNAFEYAPAGTPVIVTDTEAFSPGDIFSRIQLRSPSGEKLLARIQVGTPSLGPLYDFPARHFVVLGYGRYGQLPLDSAFLDRALVRIPKEEDIRTFVANRAGESEESAEVGIKAGVKPTGEKVEKKDFHLQSNRQTQSSPTLFDVASAIPDTNFFVLNPFTDLLLRFNYTEVDSVRKYAAGLTEELRDVRITFHRKNKTRRVAIVLLTDLPEAENAFPSGLVKLNMIVQATIAVSMITAFLTCLCMCRMMYLLKSR